jgi:hypothetical protein
LVSHVVGLEDIKNMAAGGDIQKIEEEIFSRLGRVLMELSTTKTSKPESCEWRKKISSDMKIVLF